MMLTTLAFAAGMVLMQDRGWVDARILEIRPTAEERKFDTIAWVPSIGQALRLAKEHNRPILMFTYDGQMHTGRC